MDQLLPSLLEDLRPHLDVPVVLFGHCCGALIAFEVGRRLPTIGGHGLKALLVAGRRAPMLQASRTLSQLPAGELVVELVSRGGMSPDAAAIPELVEFILPAVRADLELEETYRYHAWPRLECPVVALVGDSDHTVPADAVNAWSEVAPQGFDVESIPGDHFAIWGEADRILRLVSSRWLH
jgi:surfactin synthase thioesterase subunit